MTISQGLVAPKAMQRCAADGQQVNIPALPIFSMKGRSEEGQAYYWIYVFYCGCTCGKSHVLCSITTPRETATLVATPGELTENASEKIF